MDLQLQGKTALVTGATAGIGFSIAERLAAEGAGVVLAGRSREKLDAAAAKVKAQTREGANVSTILADAGTAQGCAQIAEEAPDVDILVNNLGIYESKPFEEIADADWLRLFEVNVLSGVRLSRAFFPKMLARNWGRIVFVSSESSLMIPGEMIHYGMTKTAQLSLSRGLAGLTKGTGVTVNAVLPGPTRSEGVFDFIRSVARDPDAPADRLEAEFFDTMRPTSLLRRMIEPEEVAALVAFVASPLAAATNGAALRVEGGLIPTAV